MRARLRALRRALRRRIKHPALWRRLEIVAVAVIGAWLGILAWGHVDAGVGPVETRLAVVPNLHGDSTLDIAPLGTLSIDSHEGPAGLGVTVKEVSLEDARGIVDDPTSLDSLGEQLTDDLRSGLIRLAGTSAVAAVTGSLLLGLLVFRWRTPTLWAGAVSLALVATTGGVTYATWNPRSVAEPRYTGLLTSAPSVVGSAESLVSNFNLYETQLAKIVSNVSRLYDVTSTLPVYEPGGRDTIALLHVSDIHLNPSSWEIVRSVTRQFQVDLVVDSGDLSDHGTTTEDQWFTQGIGTLDAPYVFVRGNHDSVDTARLVARQPNATVLDHQVAEVAGLRIYGAGDPRFTPDKETRDNQRPLTIQQFGRSVAREVALIEPPPDVAVVHDDEAAEYLDGTTPLALSGHRHVRNTWVMDGGMRMFRQGSTGGSGLRGLEKEEPTPITLSVLYFDASTRRLQAWDDITVGGLGLTSAEISRHLAEEENPSPDESPGPLTPTPTGSVPGSTPTPVPAGTPANPPGTPASTGEAAPGG
ncbi:MAG: metallophosphoesterase [Actinomycetes bacterium]